MTHFLKLLLNSTTALRTTLFLYARPACGCTVPYCAGHRKNTILTKPNGSLVRLQGFGANTLAQMAPAPYDGSRAHRRQAAAAA
jgi:hypothetical protein